ncbi:uncharacterized protein LOC115782935 isoform X1 [Archocentrus centrarchus]|uniref:uncharacterized protein LOC115782935 isoform X1 n=2 Tax=Archocentrus centrarchus TaxID=63155 RepID=UPI0011EA0401|nr:uncharacterized protein LOC115782935 isoform X1 [Archocentrus centrarchus]
MATGSYVLFRESRRVTLKEDDMSVDKICRIFQVNCSSLYITDDANTAIFPEPAGHFSILNLSHHSHYEVHGDPVHSPLPASRSLPTTGIPFAFMHRPSPSALTDTPRPSAGTPRASNLFPARSFQRAIHIAKIVNDKLSTSKTVIIRFLEAEANVEGITQKVKDALGCDEVITLTDSQGNEIVDSEGTRSSHYWKQNSRKIYAIFEDDFVEFQNGRTAKASRRADDSMSIQEVIGKIDQLKQAAESLQDITSAINQLSELAKHTRKAVTDAHLHSVKDAFACLVCKALMEEPMFSTCCESLVGCRTCVEQWLLTADHCLKCRAEEFDRRVHQVKGLHAVLSLLKEI